MKFEREIRGQHRENSNAKFGDSIGRKIRGQHIEIREGNSGKFGDSICGEIRGQHMKFAGKFGDSISKFGREIRGNSGTAYAGKFGDSI